LSLLYSSGRKSCMDGILIIDKPKGFTSHQIVKKVKKILKAKKVGHGGTLDPLATGVLPIFINKATKLAPLLMNGSKRYRATLRFGIETDTQDHEGKITSESNYLIKDHQLIIKTINSFKGTIEQTPPMFSALKFQGIALYKLARKGISLDLKARKVHIHEIKVLDIDIPHVTFLVCCSPGTYIRTLCADIGKKLECGAHLVELKRLQSGNFLLNDSISLDQLQLLAEKNQLKEKLFSLSKSFKALPNVIVEQKLITTLKKSRAVLASQLKNTSLPYIKKGDVLKVTCREESLIAIVYSLVTNNRFSTIPDKERVWKLICFFNPQENTLH